MPIPASPDEPFFPSRRASLVNHFDLEPLAAVTSDRLRELDAATSQRFRDVVKVRGVRLPTTAR